MYVYTSRVFTTLSPIFSSPPPVVASKDRLFAVSQLETVRSFPRLSLFLSLEKKVRVFTSWPQLAEPTIRRG